MKAAEDAVKAYCAPSVKKDYQKLSKDAKKNLLEAVLASNQSLVHHMLAEANGIMPGAPASRKCPLVRALIERGARPECLAEVWIQQCREMLATWGDDTATEPHEKIAKYQATAMLQKQSPAYKPKDEPSLNYSWTNTIAKDEYDDDDDNGKNPQKDWSKLKKIGIKDLSLFSTSRGCFLEGKIVGEPIQPMVGGTTLIQDDAGDVLIVCFYNVLPDGIRGGAAEPMLQAKFPMGAKVRVAEPFMKIFGDGQRGVRVDDPMEMEVVIPGKTKVIDSLEAKQQGDDLVEQKRYLAAMDVYLDGIRSDDDFIPTVLSNRAQVFINEEKWGSGLCDAAASLTIRPDSEKTWMRYQTCLSKLKEGLEDQPGSKREVFGLLIQHMKSPTDGQTGKEDDKKRAEQLKKSGNDAFQKHNYGKAIQFYSEALIAAGGTLHYLLKEYALCALKTATLGDVIAFSLASLRIAEDETAVRHLATALAYLGEYKLAREVLTIITHDKNLLTADFTQALHEEIERAEQAQQMIAGFAPRDAASVLNLIVETPPLLGNYQGPVETFMTADKGRGVRATCDMDAGEVVFIERPASSIRLSSDDDRDAVLSISQNGKGGAYVEDNASVKAKAAVSHRVKRDGVLAKVLGRLSDGRTEKPLAPLSELLINLDMMPLLLPTHKEYLKNDAEEAPHISPGAVEKILHINSHGARGDNSHSEIYPAISMMNHDSAPNCEFMPTSSADDIGGELDIIGTNRPVKEGEELCVLYHESDDVVAQKWGVPK